MRYDVDLYFKSEDDCVFLECIHTNESTIADFAFDHLNRTVREKANELTRTLTLQLVLIENDGSEHVMKKRVCEVSS